MDIDEAEYCRRELAKRFYDAISATKSEDSEYVMIDFSKLPREWRIALPGRIVSRTDAPPPTINALDFIRHKLPGLWGYAEASGVGHEEMCTRCGKCFAL